MSFRGSSGGRRERDFKCERGKGLAIGRGDSERYQASDKAHASFFFSQRKRKRMIFFWDYPMFLLSKIWHNIKFCRKKLKMRRRKNQASCTSEKRREDDILFLACNVEKNCI